MPLEDTLGDTPRKLLEDTLGRHLQGVLQRCPSMVYSSGVLYEDALQWYPPGRPPAVPSGVYFIGVSFRVYSNDVL
jgi:hypothetical protein